MDSIAASLSALFQSNSRFACSIAFPNHSSESQLFRQPPRAESLGGATGSHWVMSKNRDQRKKRKNADAKNNRCGNRLHCAATWASQQGLKS